MSWNRNGWEWEWTEIAMENGNQNKLFTWTVGIRIEMSWIAINVFTLSCNQKLNELNCYKPLKSLGLPLMCLLCLGIGNKMN